MENMRGIINLGLSYFQAHPFHLVSPSLWAIFVSVCVIAIGIYSVVILKISILCPMCAQRGVESWTSKGKACRTCGHNNRVIHLTRLSIFAALVSLIFGLDLTLYLL